MRPSAGYVTILSMPNYFRFFLFFLVLIFIPGCAWLGLSKNAVGNEKTSGDVVVADPFVKAGNIIDAQRLEKGGKLLVVPFPAGANVVVNERTDKIALMIVKGIADELKDPRFHVLDEATAHEAQLVITGHVTASGESSRWDRWVLRKTQNTVSVEGRMVDAASGATVLVFTHSARASTRREDPAQSGYDIGRDIGRFIISSGSTGSPPALSKARLKAGRVEGLARIEESHR